MADLARLSIAIDSATAKTAATDLRNLTAAGEATQTMAQKLTKICTGLNVALGYLGIKAKDLIKDATLLAARYDTLGVVMQVAGRNAGYTSGQMAAFEK